MDPFGLESIAIIGVIFLVLIFFVIGGVFVVLIVSNRADPDVTGRRPSAVYAYATAFITLFLTLAMTTEFIGSLCQLIGSHPNPLAQLNQESGIGAVQSLGQAATAGQSVGDSVARGCVLSAIAALIALALYILHIRAAARLSADAEHSSPVARVRASYLAAVSFLSVFIVAISLIGAVYGIFSLVSPGVFSPGVGGRAVILRGELPRIYLVIAAAAILIVHLRQSPPDSRPQLLSRIPVLPGERFAAGAQGPQPPTSSDPIAFAPSAPLPPPGPAGAVGQVELAPPPAPPSVLNPAKAAVPTKAAVVKKAVPTKAAMVKKAAPTKAAVVKKAAPATKAAAKRPARKAPPA